MPSWCISGALSKGLISLFLALIALQYLFNAVSNGYSRSHVPFEENDRYNVHHHSALFTALLNNMTNFPYNASQHNNNNNLTTLTSNNLITSSSGESNSTQTGASSDVSITDIFLPMCPPIPPDLNGGMDIIKSPVPTIEDLENRLSWLKPGGHWFPDKCQALYRVAIVIPYRARGEHLLLFLQHMHPFLRRQQLDYTIFVVEQYGEGSFNRAMLMNVGFAEATKQYPFDCFIFHDVDLLPEDDRNLYSCPEQPRHMSVAVDIFHYKLPYASIFGGVSALTKTQFETVNGFSNSFWGWGGEDDDMSNRIKYHNFHISRYPINIARYTMLTHKKEKANPKRYEVLSTGKNKYSSDGLNSLLYSVKDKKMNKLYTWILAELHKPS